MTRVLCVDYGRSRAGLAVSDPLGHTAQPLDVLIRPKKGSLVDEVCAVADRLEAGEIVVGLPLRLDGSEGAAADAVRQFAKALEERCGRPVHLFDERLSTKEAERGMRSGGVGAKGQRGVVDKVAAAVVLRAYLDANRPDASPLTEADDPEPVPDPPPPAQTLPSSGGRAARKRRVAEKRARKRTDRRKGERGLGDR